MHTYVFAPVSTRKLIDTKNLLIRISDFILKLASLLSKRFCKSKLYKLTNFMPKKETSPRHSYFLI
jgi:hypothetical protein